MDTRARDARLYDRTDECGTWGTITGIQLDGPDQVLITVKGWYGPGEPMIDTIRRHVDDLIVTQPAQFLPLLVDLYGHLITDTNPQWQAA